MAATAFDFHEVSLGVPLLSLACARFVRGRWRGASGWALGLLLVKEDAVLMVLGFAAALWARGQRRLALLLAGVGVGWTALVVFVVMPWINGGGQYTYLSGGSAGPDVITLLETLRQSLVWPGLASLTALVLVAVTAAACLRSPLVFVALLPWLVRAAVPNWRYWVLSYHYSLLPAVALFFAALDSGTLQRSLWRRKLVAVLAVVSALAAVPTIGVKTLGNDPSEARQAVAQVPSGVHVAAVPKISAHLATRAVVSVVVPGKDPTEPGEPTSGATWVVLDKDLGWARDLAAGPYASWRTVWSSNRFVVLTSQR